MTTQFHLCGDTEDFEDYFASHWFQNYRGFLLEDLVQVELLENWLTSH